MGWLGGGAGWFRMMGNVLDFSRPVRIDGQTTHKGGSGAIRMSPDALADRHHEIPRDREVVLVCT